jgi:hypothetical protein
LPGEVLEVFPEVFRLAGRAGARFLAAVFLAAGMEGFR